MATLLSSLTTKSPRCGTFVSSSSRRRFSDRAVRSPAGLCSPARVLAGGPPSTAVVARRARSWHLAAGRGAAAAASSPTRSPWSAASSTR